MARSFQPLVYEQRWSVRISFHFEPCPSFKLPISCFFFFPTSS